MTSDLVANQYSDSTTHRYKTLGDQNGRTVEAQTRSEWRVIKE